jgi:hypothetical protein
LGRSRCEAWAPTWRQTWRIWGSPETWPDEYSELWFGKEDVRFSADTFAADERGWGKVSASCPEVAGGYQHAGVTLE